MRRALQRGVGFFAGYENLIRRISNSTDEIFVSGEEAYAALERASHLFVRVAGTGTAQIAIEISAFPGRDIPATLPSGWTRVL